MKSRTFLIPSLLMAGFGGPVAAQESAGESAAVSEPDARGKSAAVSLFRADRPILLAGHSSHRSHSSHSSHRSSSGGGVYYPPSPPPPPPPPPPRARPNTLLTLPSAEPQDQRDDHRALVNVECSQNLWRNRSSLFQTEIGLHPEECRASPGTNLTIDWSIVVSIGLQTTLNLAHTTPSLCRRVTRYDASRA